MKLRQPLLGSWFPPGRPGSSPSLRLTCCLAEASTGARICTLKQNPNGSEASTLRELTCHHLEYLRTPSRFSGVGLEPPLRECKGVLRKLLLDLFGADAQHVDMYMSASARFSSYGRVCKGDVICAKSQDCFVVGRIQFLVFLLDECIAIIQRFNLIKNTLTSGEWQAATIEPHVICLDEILEPLHWSECGGRITVLYPFSVRHIALVC